MVDHSILFYSILVVGAVINFQLFLFFIYKMAFITDPLTVLPSVAIYVLITYNIGILDTGSSEKNVQL